MAQIYDWRDQPGGAAIYIIITVSVVCDITVTGASTGIGSDFDVATIKYTSDGDSVWTQRYNGPGNGYVGANKIAIDDNENVYVTGSSVGIDTYTDFVTIKYIPTQQTPSLSKVGLLVLTLLLISSAIWMMRRKKLATQRSA